MTQSSGIYKNASTADNSELIAHMTSGLTAEYI